MGSRSASSGKAPLLVFIQPTRLPRAKEEQLLQIIQELQRLFGHPVIGGEIVGATLAEITRAGDVSQVTMTISTRIRESDTT